MGPRRQLSAWDRAVAALARRALTEAEIAARVSRAGHSDDEVAEVLRRLAERRLIDDRAVAYNLAQARAREGRYGPLRVRSELAARGVPSEIVSEVMAEAFAPEAVESAARRAWERLARRRTRTATDRSADLRRLLRDGFPPAVVRRVAVSAVDEGAADRLGEAEE